MIHIRSPADLAKSRLPQHLHQAASRVLTGILDTHGSAYAPEHDGHLIVVTPTDTEASMTRSLGTRWRDSMFEGVSYSQDTRTWHVVYLHNNQFTMSVIVADAAWLDPGIRQRILREMQL